MGWSAAETLEVFRVWGNNLYSISLGLCATGRLFPADSSSFGLVSPSNLQWNLEATSACSCSSTVSSHHFSRRPTNASPTTTNNEAGRGSNASF